jgi:hypothetical protein
VTDEEQFGNWLAGFIDGEGCFWLQKINDASGRTTYSVRFEIKLRADDCAILQECRDRLGIGNVHYGQTTNPKHGDVARWAVRSHSDREVLIALLDKCPLRAKKARDYAIWREASQLTRGIQHTGGRGKAQTVNQHVWARVGQLYQQLKEERAYKHD